MSSTIEAISDNIDKQIDLLSSGLRLVELDCLNETYQKLLLDINKDFVDTCETYYTDCIGILIEYYAVKEANDRQELHDRFVKAFHSNNIIGRFDRVHHVIYQIRQKYKILNIDLTKILRDYRLITIDESFKNNSSDVCPNCSTPYEIEEKTVEYTCRTCGLTEKMKGVVFEDEQFYYQEGHRTKHGKYDPIKHAKFWLDRIQAKENTTIPDNVLGSVKKHIQQDSLWVDKIDCETVRYYLKKSKLTAYNNHVSLIRKLITGKQPEQLTDHEIGLVYMHFSMVIQQFEIIKNKNKSNCPYHPFFIYKIIEQILKHPRDRIRRINILSCIHLQSRDTLIENDKLWFSIIDNLPDSNFTKLSTDRGSRKF